MRRTATDIRVVFALQALYQRSVARLRVESKHRTTTGVRVPRDSGTPHHAVIAHFSSSLVLVSTNYSFAHPIRYQWGSQLILDMEGASSQVKSEQPDCHGKLI
jgi:hypothetical protein